MSQLEILSTLLHTTSFIFYSIEVEEITEHGVMFFITNYSPLVEYYNYMLYPRVSLQVRTSKSSIYSNVSTVYHKRTMITNNDSNIKVLIELTIYNNGPSLQLSKYTTFQVMVMSSRNCSEYFLLPGREILRGPLLD